MIVAIMKNNALKSSVMRRVRMIWFLKRLISPLFVRGYILAIFTWQLFAQVSIANVIHNAPGLSNIPKNLPFFTDAFIASDLIVKIYMGGAMIIGMWFLADFSIKTLRGFMSSPDTRHA
jgi:hypothetical protein